MIEPSSLLSATGFEAIFSYAAGIAVKVDAAVAHGFWHRSPARPRASLARSSLWHATLAALALLPLATLLLPPLSVVRWDKASGTASDERKAAPVAQPPSAVVRTTVAHGSRAERVPAELAGDGGPVLAGSLVPPYEPSKITFRQGLAWGVLGAYLAGCLVLLIRFTLSLRAVFALLATAEPVTDERWCGLLAHWRRQLSVARAVRLLTSSEAAVPVQIGWLRPAILLPPRVAASNDESTRTAVLVHELGHVQRSDYGWNLLLRVLSIIYWPHPLVWLAGRRTAQLREQACDELCIHWLSGAATYRAKLIELAAGIALAAVHRVAGYRDVSTNEACPTARMD